MEYVGYRVSLNAKFGKMKDKIQIDIGIGDLVTPVEMLFCPFEYKGKPIFEREIRLLTYPVETIFAEKLETIISKGVVNSRMKDYHDITLMMRQPGLLDLQKLRSTLQTTFRHRETALNFSIVFDVEGMKSLKILWANHLRGLGAFRQKLELPETFESVLYEINTWLAKNLKA